MKHTLGKHGGTWCVVCEDNQWSTPERVTLYWPIREQQRFNAGDEGLPMEEWNNSYAIRLRGLGWQTVHLANGGQTLPIHKTIDPIPRPAARGKEVRYYNGQWQRLLKTRGWVAA